MESYFLVKWLHVLSSTLLFGTGLGTAFFMWMAHRRGDVGAIAVTTRHVVLADWLFTTPAVIIQPATGFWMLSRLGIDWTQPWVALSLVLYLLTGLCWLPVVWIQLRVRDIAGLAATSGQSLPPRYHRLMRWWFTLGWPAFLSVLVIFWLMLRKPIFVFPGT
ncbi:MAG: DUF2269 domain-containing protein [Lysobacteraceae bacterium]